MKSCIFNVVFKNRSPHQAFKLASDIGYDAVELWGKEPHISADTSVERLKEQKKMAAEYGLDIAAIGSYIGGFSTASDKECKEKLEEAKKYMEVMEVLDVDLIRVGPGGPSGFEAQDYHYEKAAYWLQEIADLAKKHNKKIGIETHGNRIIETVDETIRLLEMVDRSNLGVIHDAGNLFLCTDTEYGYETIKKLGDKIFHVHVKGERFVDDLSLPSTHKYQTRNGERIFQQVMLKDSQADYDSVFKGLKEIGYDGYVSTECFAPASDIERAEGDLKEIKRLIGEE